jgi:hypothetical protein
MNFPCRFLPTLLLVGALTSVAAPAAAGAETPAYAPVLAFAGDTAHAAAGQVAVPVECPGESSEFCSGTVTLTRGGQHATVPFSVRGDAEETLFVPLRLEGTGRPVRVSAVLLTQQALGGPVSAKTQLFVR